MTTLAKLVADWDGFEELVAEMHRHGSVRVDRDIVLVGKSGAPRQIDVLLTHEVAPYTYKTIVECKYWNSTVERRDVENVVATIDELNAAHGVIFTTKGYQSGAILYAKSKGIRIFVVRDLSDHEWGRPGRVLDFILQVWSRTVAAAVFPEAFVEAHRKNYSPSPKLELSVDPKTWTTPTRRLDGTPWKPLEQLIFETSLASLQKVVSASSLTFHGGADGTYYMKQQLDVAIPNGILVKTGDEEWDVAACHKLELQLGYRINQSRIVIDRGASFQYALAVEDCVNGQLLLTSRKAENSPGEWRPLVTSTADDEEVLQNGTILRVTVKGYFDPKELVGREEVPFAPTPLSGRTGEAAAATLGDD